MNDISGVIAGSFAIGVMMFMVVSLVMLT